jgi:hypothetical protein
MVTENEVYELVEYLLCNFQLTDSEAFKYALAILTLLDSTEMKYTYGNN